MELESAICPLRVRSSSHDRFAASKRVESEDIRLCPRRPHTVEASLRLKYNKVINTVYPNLHGVAIYKGSYVQEYVRPSMFEPSW